MSSYPGYTPTDWVDNTTLVDEARLDKMELGIKNAADAVQDLDKRVSGAGGTMTGEWAYSNTTAAPPAAGQVRFDQNPPPAATKVWIANVTAPGTDAKNLLLQTKAGQKLYIQDKDDATKWIEFVATADATDQGTYVEIAVTLDKNGGSLSSGQRILVAVTRTTTSTDLIGRLGPQALVITDWNAVLENGWYKAAPGANCPGPLSGSAILGRVEAADGTWVTQTVWDFSTGANLVSPRYERRHDGVGWGPWFFISVSGLLDAKGDLIGASGPDTPVRIPAPTVDGHALIADAAQAAGVRWGVPVSSQSPDRPIALHTPRTQTLAGNAFWTVLALAQYDWGHWEFVKDVDGYIYGLIRCSEARAAPSIVLSLTANAVAGVTRMQVGFAWIPPTGNFNPAFADIAAQDVTVAATAYQRKDVSFAIGSGVNAGDELLIRVFHNGAHANDTLAVNTLLAGAWLTGA